MNHLQTAQDIIARVGGAENIEHLEHCSTRLRLSLYDNSKVNEAELSKVPGVLGVRINAQCQVVIGNNVVQVYSAARSLMGEPQTQSNDKKKTTHKLSKGELLIDFVISIFQPLVPAIAGGGMLKSLLLLLDVLGILSRSSSTYKVLDNIGSAPMYFLPVLVAITTANKLKVNVLVAVCAVSVMILPAMTKQLADGSVFLSLDLRNVAYASQVFPAILCVLFYAQTEKLFNRYSPGTLRIFLSPMLSLMVTVPVTLLILGPLGFEVGSALSTVILWIYGKVGFIATGLLAAILPFMVASGMHKAMIPYAVASLSQTGRELLYLPASLAHNISESGACFGIAIRSKDKLMKSTALSAGISALFGITEPALYGVTMLNKRALYSVIIGGVVGGAAIGWVGIQGFALVGPGLASISMFVSPDNPMNIFWAMGGFVLSFAVAFISALILWKDKQTEEVTTSEKKRPELLTFTRPVEGQVIPLEDVNDDVFSRKIIGEGIAIVPTQGVLRAPADGTIVHIFESGHALNLLTDTGVEMIFHIGIDTIRLQGKGFSSLVKEGQHVKAGDILIEFSLEIIAAAGLDPVVIMVVTNGERFTLEPQNHNVKNTNPQIIMTLRESV